ncbi:MAG: hypothetical protein IPO03_01220 [Bacteroidetes bacterium]|nr:hypothetical protein [Bacteroidota bacterium]
MGATVDQTGNIIYNQPVEICFCDQGTSLNRDENISNPMPGTTIDNRTLLVSMKWAIR